MMEPNTKGASAAIDSPLVSQSHSLAQKSATTTSYSLSILDSTTSLRLYNGVNLTCLSAAAGKRM
jgi:hypothetical protein